MVDFKGPNEFIRVQLSSNYYLVQIKLYREFDWTGFVHPDHKEITKAMFELFEISSSI